MFIGTSYKNDIQNIGACSPSYMYYHVTGDNDDGWIKKKDVNFTSDPNAHLFMGYGANEESVFHENVDRYIGVYNENKTAEQQDFVVYGSYPDGHNWNTFSREIFCFVYYMKFDTLPDDETIELACKDRNLDYGDGKTEEASGKESGGNKDIETAKGSDDKSDSKAKYSNEWVDGKWYATNGDQTYEATMSWKCNDTGWWIEDTSGWYPHSMWQKVDGNWYYFDESGYMATNEWRDGWWLSSNGALTYNEKGSWQISGDRWWFGDTSGWYAANMWQKINGCWYYFDSLGYIVTNQYVDGYWLGADGICW